MGYKTTLHSLISSKSPSTRPRVGGGGTSYGRVEDIILDENHPDYSNLGGASAINGVFYRSINQNSDNAADSTLKFAYQDNSNIKTIPVIGETVEVVVKPHPSDTGFKNKNRAYYTKVVNIFNHPNSNIYPNLTSNNLTELITSNSFKEASTVNPLRSAQGDVQLEGRNGQSIRFTANTGNANPWIDATNIGQPLTIISNGQSETEEGFTTISEDIDQDSASIYLASNHTIPLTQASNRRLSYKTPPETANSYKGAQILLNSGRLFFNANSKDIQLVSTTTIGLTTKGTVNIDAENSINLDAKAIFLGSKPLNTSEQVRDRMLLGNATESFLQDILVVLEGLAQDLSTASTVEGKPIPLLNKRGAQMLPLIQGLKTRINPDGLSSLKSRKIFIE